MAARHRLIAALKCHAAAFDGGRTRSVDDNRLDLMLALYRCRADEITDAVLPRFIIERQELLSDLFRAYGEDSRADTLLAPDALLIFECMEHDPDRLRDLWQRRRPLEELEDLASVYGQAL